jgi:hypothetical protein
MEEKRLQSENRDSGRIIEENQDSIVLLSQYRVLNERRVVKVIKMLWKDQTK